MSPDAACLKSSPLSAPGCPGVQTHCVHHPILVRFSVLSGVMEWLCVLVSVLVCISCPLHPDQCPMPSWCVPLCPPLHSNAMHSSCFQYTHTPIISTMIHPVKHTGISSHNPPVNSVHTQHTPGQEKSIQTTLNRFISKRHNAVSVQNSVQCHC